MSADHAVRGVDTFLGSLAWHLMLVVPLTCVLPSQSQAPGRHILTAVVETVRGPIDESRCDGRPVLCPVFLGKKSTLPSALREDFQSSGLAHLVALSGGQTGPLAACVAACAALPGLLVVGTLKALRRRRFHLRLRRLAEISAATLAAFLYGASGALLRVPFFGAGLLGARTIPRRPLVRAAALTAVSCFLGNALANPSFLLSSLGCEAVFLAALLASPLRVRSNAQQPTLLPAPILHALTVTVATSLLMAVFLWPFSRSTLSLEALLLAAQANLLAVPLVNFVVTPLSLLEIVAATTSATGDIVETVAACYDRALETLARLASAFAFVGGQGAPTALFSALKGPWAPPAFAAFFALLWSIRDAVAGHRRRALRSEFAGRLRVSRRSRIP